LLKIERLGPLKEGVIELRDLTLLIGLPNTGKSYTLKALYAKLFLLDGYTHRFVHRAVSNYVTTVAAEIEDAVYELVEALLKSLPQQGASKEGLLTSDVHVTEMPLAVEVSAMKPAVINFSVYKILRDTVNTIVSGSLDPESVYSSLLMPVDASKAGDYIVAVISSQAFQTEFMRTAVDAIDVSDRLRGLLEKSVHNQDAVRRSIVVAKLYPEMYFVRATGKSVDIVLLPRLRVELDAESIKAVTFEAPVVQDSVLRLFAKEVARELVDKYTEAVSRILYGLLADYITYSTGLTSMRFIPAYRSGITMELEYIGPGHLDTVEKLYPPIASSYAHWYIRGRKVFTEGRLEEQQRKLLNAAAPLLEGSLSTDGFRILYRDWGGAADLRLASSLAREVVSILFPLLTTGGRSLLLIEEPEAHLHPRAQVVMALFVAALPSLCGCRAVITTHSDLFAITIAQLAVQKPSKEQVNELIKDLVPHASEGVDVLAESVAEASERAAVAVYEHTENGEVKYVEPATLLSERVPSITEVTDKLIAWASRVAAQRNEERYSLTA